ncbi:MAG: acylphosphatase [Chitinispirillaceae bacterium]|nr:acylphosphatase [Chitinispirillaceae bacterium]
MKRVGVRVSGRVQGVGFRYFTRSLAARYQLSGWVRNVHGAGVELEAQGIPEKLDAWLIELRKGPPLSNVTDFTVSELPVVEGEQGFVVRH